MTFYRQMPRTGFPKVLTNKTTLVGISPETACVDDRFGAIISGTGLFGRI